MVSILSFVSIFFFNFVGGFLVYGGEAVVVDFSSCCFFILCFVGLSGRPMLLSEWRYGSTDSFLVSGCGYNVISVLMTIWNAQGGDMICRVVNGSYESISVYSMIEVVVFVVVH